jgi:heme/copper-type cytochrome/quinol oxidase subunit 3
MVRYAAGTICLALAILLIAMGAPTVAAGSILRPRELPAGMVVAFLAAGVFFAVFAAYSWVRAVKLTPGDDILSDQRGLLVALMLVTTLLLGGAMLWLMAHPSFWRGAIDGLIGGASR